MRKVLRNGLALAMALAGSWALAPLSAEPPHFVQGSEHPALILDGEPFLALGVQANNSSNYPAMLETVWPMMDRLSANTLLMPLAWEQVEPVEGQFDFAFLDTLLAEARAHDKRLVLLWYGAFKNTSAAYTPAWVKQDGERFARMRHSDGRAHGVMSPHDEDMRDADARAFAAVMRHLAQNDPQHTVIMMQVENESGSWGLGRDHSSAAQALYAAPIPAELAEELEIARAPWEAAFASRAEQFFMSWHMARYIEAVASAGLAEWELPILVNAALGNAFTDETGENGPSGGPNWNALPIWRVAAPNIDAYGPDIYTTDAAAVAAFLDHYSAEGWPLLVPETGNSAAHARFIWPALGRGAVLFAPFGMDASGYSNYPLGAKTLDDATLEAFAAPYRLLADAGRDWPRIAMDHPTWGAARGADGEDQSHTLGRWRVTAQYARWQFGEDDWTWLATDPHPLAEALTGGALVAQLGENTFLVTGRNVRVRLGLADAQPGESGQIIEAQEGSFVDGEWVMRRRWNGDQVDYGFNFGDEPVWLRIQMGTYQ